MIELDHTSRSDSSYETVASEMLTDKRKALINDAQSVSSSRYDPSVHALHTHKKTASSLTTVFDNPYLRSSKHVTLTSMWGVDGSQDIRNSQLLQQLMEGHESAPSSHSNLARNKSAASSKSAVAPFEPSRQPSLRRQLTTRSVKSTGTLRRSNAVKRKVGWLTMLRLLVRKCKRRAAQKWRNIRQRRVFGGRKKRTKTESITISLPIARPETPQLNRTSTVQKQPRPSSVSDSQRKAAMDRLIKKSQENLIDPGHDDLIALWTSYLKSTVAKRIHLKLSIAQLAKPAATHARKESLLDSILSDYVSTDDSDTNSMASDWSSISTAESSAMDEREIADYIGYKDSIFSSESTTPIIVRQNSVAFSFAPSVLSKSEISGRKEIFST
ncbi:hypothetical protein KL936_002673 [Ogataea polymorpha]|nr:hypothetical protein KL936_002673 [Ogataea polymorpha]